MKMSLANSFFTKEITIYNNTSLVYQVNFAAAILFYLHVFNKHSIKKVSYTRIEVIFNRQTKVTSSDIRASILGLICFSEGLAWRGRISF